MVFMRLRMIVVALLLLPSVLAGQNKTRADIWQPFKYFESKWEGAGNGQPGISKTQREYRFVLNDKFLHVQNRSVYDPQPKNPKGEVHEDWGMMSFDQSRKQFVLRQFHVEGFVNQYLMTGSSADGKTIVFTTEGIENTPTGYRARETYKMIGPDEFVEVFEIAEPGKDFELYSESHYTRKR
jgi:hypothetical protein